MIILNRNIVRVEMQLTRLQGSSFTLQIAIYPMPCYKRGVGFFYCYC